jgi:putative ABC transport system substrate-binding protein
LEQCAFFVAPLAAWTVLVSAVACPIPAYAQNTKIHRVAVLFGTSPLSELKGPDPANPAARGFVHGLRDLGYVEGRNLLLDWHTIQGRYERISEVLTEIVRFKPDVIFTAFEVVAMDERYMKATMGIPVVTISTLSLVKPGVAQSLSRPGGTVTGFMMDVDISVETKRIELLRETIPKVKRIAYLANSAMWESPIGQRTREAAQRLGISIFNAPYTGLEIQAGFAVVDREAPDAVFIPVGPTSFANRQRIGEFVSAKRLPCIALFKEIVEHGCLMSYGVDASDLTRQVAGYVAKILEGAKPGDLPIQQPTKFEFVINMKEAKALGLKIPQSVLVRADRVIE